MPNAAKRSGEPLVFFLTTGEVTESNYTAARNAILEAVRAAAEAGVTHIQIREKSLPARLVHELTEDAVVAAEPFGVKILVNDRFDIALAANAHGVHLSGVSVPARVVRKIVPPAFIIGVSAHSPEEVAAAKNAGADYAFLSPIFESPGKGKPLGLLVLEKTAADLAHFPVIALGGIDASNCGSVLLAGAAGFAAIRFLNDTDGLAKFKQWKLTNRKFV